MCTAIADVVATDLLHRYASPLGLEFECLHLITDGLCARIALAVRRHGQEAVARRAHSRPRTRSCADHRSWASRSDSSAIADASAWESTMSVNSTVASTCSSSTRSASRSEVADLLEATSPVGFDEVIEVAAREFDVFGIGTCSAMYLPHSIGKSAPRRCGAPVSARDGRKDVADVQLADERHHLLDASARGKPFVPSRRSRGSLRSTACRGWCVLGPPVPHIAMKIASSSPATSGLARPGGDVGPSSTTRAAVDPDASPRTTLPSAEDAVRP